MLVQEMDIWEMERMVTMDSHTYTMYMMIYKLD
jgi:hypothetical protein